MSGVQLTARRSALGRARFRPNLSAAGSGNNVRHRCLGVLCLLGLLAGTAGCGGGEEGSVSEAGCKAEIERQLGDAATETRTVPDQCRGIDDLRLLQLAREAGAVHPPVATATPVAP